MKEAEKKVPIEGVELVLAVLGPHADQPVTEVASVSVEEAFPLYEVYKHQAVQSYRRVPLTVSAVGDAGNEGEKCRVLLLETLVEALGDSLDVKPRTGASGDVRQGEAFLFFQSKRDGAELLQQGIAGLGPMERVLAARGGLAGLPFHPLPNLGFVRRIGEDD